MGSKNEQGSREAIGRPAPYYALKMLIPRKSIFSALKGLWKLADCRRLFCGDAVHHRLKAGSDGESSRSCKAAHRRSAPAMRTNGGIKGEAYKSLREESIQQPAMGKGFAQIPFPSAMIIRKSGFLGGFKMEDAKIDVQPLTPNEWSQLRQLRNNLVRQVFPGVGLDADSYRDQLDTLCRVFQSVKQ